MKFAYADPPYPGQAKRWYADHPDYGGEVDHAELIGRLERDYDGWALSTNAISLQSVLALCPPTVRVAVWVNSSSQPPSRPGWWWCWEPVIIHGGQPATTTRNVLTCGTHRQGRFPGGKPPAFSRWIFTLLGAGPGDELDDLFPGSGAVTTEWQRYRNQPMMPEPKRRYWDPNPARMARVVARDCDPLA